MAIPIRGLSQFKSALTGGGARPNLFEVVLPAGIPVDPQGLGRWSSDVQLKNRFLCKSAALPASNSAAIEIPFRGRTFKVSGDRSFDTWTVTMINDEDFQLRRVMEGWMQALNQYSDHSGLTNPVDYMRDAQVFQLGRGKVTEERGQGSGGDANIIAQYYMQDIFPTNVSAIDLSYESENQIEEFTVEFQVNFFYPVKNFRST